MNKLLIFLSALAVAGLTLSSCNNLDNDRKSSDFSGLSEMTFSVKGDGISMAVTKAEAVTSLSSVYWASTAGATGADEQVYAPVSLSLDNGKASTGKYWPAESIAYNYYVSNVSFSWNASSSKATIAASNEKDIVAGIAEASYKSSPTVILEHIFARTGSLTLNAQDGFSLVGNAVWKIKSNSGTGVSGTYDIGSAAWSDVSALPQQAFASDSDLYLIPGSYNVEITYTLKKDDFQKEFTKSANVTLEGGACNNITATAHVGSDEPSEISLTVEVKPWGSNNITIGTDELN